MKEQEFREELEDILKTLFKEKITDLELMYWLSRSAIEFEKCGQIEECDLVWKYARRFYSIGRVVDDNIFSCTECVHKFGEELNAIPLRNFMIDSSKMG